MVLGRRRLPLVTLVCGRNRGLRCTSFLLRTCPPRGPLAILLVLSLLLLLLLLLLELLLLLLLLLLLSVFRGSLTAIGRSTCIVPSLYIRGASESGRGG